MHVKFQETKYEEVSEDSEEHTDDCSQEQLQDRTEKSESDNDTTPDTVPHSCDMRSSSPQTVSEEGDFRVVRHSPPVRALTRKDVEDRAWVKANAKFPAGDTASAPPPPTPVEVSGLYTLITEVKCDWMPLELLDDPQACMEFLHKMVEDGTLGVKLSSAFGTWYLFGNAVRFVNLHLCHSILLTCCICAYICIVIGLNPDTLNDWSLCSFTIIAALKSTWMYFKI